jgi:hypothetical protein
MFKREEPSKSFPRKKRPEVLPKPMVPEGHQEELLKCGICGSEMAPCLMGVSEKVTKTQKHTLLCAKKDEGQSELDNLDQELMELKARIVSMISEVLTHPQ